jgi:Ca2+-binding RTX toxin-like protein
MGIAAVRSYILVDPVAGTDSSQSSVAVLSDGRFAVSYNSTSGVVMRVFTADGTPSTGQISVGVGGESKVAALAGGRFVVTSTGYGSNLGDTNGAFVVARIFNADGTLYRPEFLVNAATLYDQTASSVRGLADGRFVVTYTDASTSAGVFGVTDIRARIFNADGTQSVPEFVVNSATPVRQNESAVTVLADGRILVTYSVFTPPIGNTPGVTEDRWDIRARILNPDGSQSVGEFRINGTVYLNQQDSSVAALSNGGFVVAYDNTDADFGGVSARIFTANGVQTVAEFRVNASATGLQRDSQVAALPDGRFVVIFADNTMGVSPAVHTQRAVIYNNDGTLSVPEFIVQTSDFFMLDSSISVMADGRFVITVSDRSDAAGDGVAKGTYAHIFDPKRYDGTANADTVTGGNFGDVINGNAGNDVIYGYGGNDFLMGGVGADYINGGDGYDTASYANATSGVDARLYTGTGTVGEAAYDAFVSIEALQGSSYADNLFGDGLVNILYGGAGDDYLDGLGGGDYLFGESGNDWFNLRSDTETIDGGTGFDLVSYLYAAAGVTARLDFAALNKGNAAGDTYTSVEGIVGSGFNDSLVGTDGAGDYLTAQGGDDYIAGRGGNDTLRGDDGNDQFWGGEGADSLDGGAGYDIARYDFAESGVVARLDGGTNAGEAAGDIFNGVEALFGSAFGDILVGDETGNYLLGLSGGDLLYGRGGNDTLLGGAGADAFGFNTAGFGTDTVLDFATTASAGAAHDYVDFRGLALSSFAITQSGANTVVTTNHGTVILQGITASTLVVGDFLF